VHTKSGRAAFSNANATKKNPFLNSHNLLMRNGTYFAGEKQNPSTAVAFCAARTFFAITSQAFPEQS
jgi:hypothetical protein